MRRYLSTLHTKPERHKKQFAFLASSSITLFIFGVWSLATFGINSTNTKIVAESGSSQEASAQPETEVSPFESLRMNLSTSLEAFRENFGALKSGLKAVDLEAEYKEMRDGALDVYGE
ncbi:MAG: hypothetical protein Q7R69_03540 [bacterium]|nr:hypothetical protein [bacterium]